MSLEVFCLVIDAERTVIGEPFSVLCNPDDLIHDLKDNAMEKQAASFANMAGHLLEVYHSPKLRPLMSKNEIVAAFAQIDFDAAQVHSLRLVKDVVPDPENTLLLIQKPVHSLKRSLSPSSTDHYQRVKRSRFFNMAPSTSAKVAEYKAIQNQPSERLLDDRPQPDFHVAPITLLYAPFGRFDDIFTGQELLDADSGINLAALEQDVDALANAMLGFYADKDSRRGAALVHFRNIGLPLEPSTIGSTGFTTDGHSHVEGFIDTCLEIKNEPPDANAFAYVQCALYVGNSFKEETSKDVAESMCKYRRVPALCITLIGNEIQFYGTILLGHQYRTVSLTPSLSCVPCARDGKDRKDLYSAFAAALLLRKQIKEDIKAYIAESHRFLSTTVLNDEEYFFPAVSKILEYGRNPNDKRFIEFKILGYHGQRESYRHLYVAKVTGGASAGSEILVKFTRRYCADLHDYCFRQGHAPKLLGFQSLPGGWFAIAMEYLADAIGLAMLPTSSYWDKAHTQSDWDTALLHCDEVLIQLVTGFHTEGLVHGDLRLANILCDESGGKLWLIDFDWGGKEGKVRYPTWNLNEHLQFGRRSKTLEINKEDDLRVLRTTLRLLKGLRNN